MDKYVYISIPKTGTNSIHEILGNTKYNHLTANTIKNKIGEKLETFIKKEEMY